MEVLNTIGRRKTSVARIYLAAGKGEITVNGRDYKEYFPAGTLQTIINQPFSTLEEVGKFDVTANVSGGGVTGQAEALRLAIARALSDMTQENRKPLKSEGYLTRDPRMVERKKPGRRKARRRFQFSKR